MADLVAAAIDHQAIVSMKVAYKKHMKMRRN